MSETGSRTEARDHRAPNLAEARRTSSGLICPRPSCSLFPTSLPWPSCFSTDLPQASLLPHFLCRSTKTPPERGSDPACHIPYRKMSRRHACIPDLFIGRPESTARPIRVNLCLPRLLPRVLQNPVLSGSTALHALHSSSPAFHPTMAAESLNEFDRDDVAKVRPRFFFHVSCIE